MSDESTELAAHFLEEGFARLRAEGAAAERERIRREMLAEADSCVERAAKLEADPARYSDEDFFKLLDASHALRDFARRLEAP